jgi:hypothetical protein
VIRQSLVFPFREDLVPRLAGLAVVPRVGTLENVGDVLNPLYRVGSEPRCLLVESEAPLTSAGLHPGLAGVPIALRVPCLGPIAEFIRLLPVLRQLNLRVYIPACGDGNLTSVRILSSLGFATAVLLDGEEPDWDGLSDLMTYAFFGQVPHAPIAPFGYLLDNFDQRGRSEFEAVYFDDPRSYLHMDAEGRVALTRGDLERGEFLADDVESIRDGVEDMEPFRARMDAWSEHFLNFDACSSCPGWRVCSGRFARERQPDEACRAFCSELLDNLEKSRAARRDTLTLWQP